MQGIPVVSTSKKDFMLPPSDSAEYASLRCEGRISFKPAQSVGTDGKTYIHFSDGKTRTIDAAGTIRNAHPRKRMSKKLRRKLRRKKAIK